MIQWCVLFVISAFLQGGEWYGYSRSRSALSVIARYPADDTPIVRLAAFNGKLPSRRPRVFVYGECL